MGEKHQLFINRIYELVNDEYTVLSKYKDYESHVLIRHEVCGFEYNVKPRGFLSGNRCRKCRGKSQRKTNEDFINEVFNLVGDEYTFLENYVNTKTPILIRHNKCGDTYKVSPNNFLSGGTRCRKCMFKTLKQTSTKTNEEFLDSVYRLVGNEYIFLEEYINANSPILVRHSLCGHEYKVEPANFKGGTRCPKCTRKKQAKNKRISNEEFVKRVEDLVDDEYTFLEEYIDSRTKIKVRHNLCDHEYFVKPNNFLKGRRGPECYQSRGEERINNFLKKKGISYTREKTFPDLKRINKLRFDFSIEDKEGNVIGLIEFDSKQHFIPIELFGGNEYLQGVLESDEMKNKYIVDKGIPLLRINYREKDNIEELVEEFLNDLF